MSSASDSSARKAEVLETAITQSPALERAFYEARGICEKFRQSHPSKRLCKKGADCPFLHCSKEQDYHLATNRLRAPFVHLSRTGELLVIPPFMEALRYWWTKVMKFNASCFPVVGVDVIREGDHQIVLLSLKGPEPSALSQSNDSQSCLDFGQGAVHYSSKARPDVWWHSTGIEAFPGVLANGLNKGSRGTYKALYAFADRGLGVAYGRAVLFGFRAKGMAVNLSNTSAIPLDLPEGLIGFFESNKKVQWLFHPAGIQLVYARVDFDTFCSFLGETLSTPNLGWRPYTKEYHIAIFGLAGLQVPQLVEGEDDPYAYDYDGPHDFTADPPLKLRGNLSEEQQGKLYGRGASILKSMGYIEVYGSSVEEHPVMRLWDYGQRMSFEGAKRAPKRSLASLGESEQHEFVKAAPEPDSSGHPEADMVLMRSAETKETATAVYSPQIESMRHSTGRSSSAGPDPQAAASKSCRAPSPSTLPDSGDDLCYYHWTGVKCTKTACVHMQMLGRRASPKNRWVCAEHRDMLLNHGVARTTV